MPKRRRDVHWRYIDVTERLLYVRTLRSQTQVEENVFLAELDECWRGMTIVEQLIVEVDCIAIVRAAKTRGGV